MKKRQILPILAAFVPLLSSLSAGPLLKEDFKSFSPGDSMPPAGGKIPGTWHFSPNRQGSTEAIIKKLDSGEQVVAVSESLTDGVRGTWYLYRLLETPPAVAEMVALGVRFRVNTASIPFDWVFGAIDQEFRSVPGNTNMIGLFRVRNNHSSGQIEFRYWRPDLKEGEGAYAASGTSLVPGIWYRLRVLIKPAEAVMSVRLVDGEGGVLIEERGIPLKSPVGQVAGVAFKNRVADLNAVDFSLAEVVMESGTSLPE